MRDDKVASGGSEHLHTASPFNIKVRLLTMRVFTADEVAELYAQHTAETGQRVEDAALRQAFAHTQGQPWLVNGLAYVVTTELKSERARDVLVERQDTHLDSLAERLRDPRVRAVIEPMIQGESLAALAPDGRIDWLLEAFVAFWVQHGEAMLASSPYNEAAAHRVMMPFLRRGGERRREYRPRVRHRVEAARHRGQDLARR